MKVEMLVDRNYRGSHTAAGTVLDMDGPTAQWFVDKRWARPYTEPAPLTVAEAEELAPTGVVRRKALR